MPRKILRFGIVDGIGHRAASWNIATRTGGELSEVYLSCRELRGAIHSSMHHSGNWHVTYTQKAFDQLLKDIRPPGSDRFIEKWPRPSEIRPGITLAYRIVTPWTAARTEIRSDEKNFIEIPNAPESKATEIMILFVRPGKQLLLKNCTPIGTLALNNRETVVVIHHVIDMPDFKHTQPARAKLMSGRSKDDLKGDSLRLIGFGDCPDGSRALWDCAVEMDTSEKRFAS